MMSDYAAFILTHGRPEGVRTYKTLRDQGYTGKVFFIIDDEDPKKNEYKKKFGIENVVEFSKKEVAKRFDRGDNFNEFRSVVYARNASFDIAKSLGLKNFIEFDDDYTRFGYVQSDSGKYLGGTHKVLNLDSLFESFFSFLNKTSVVSVAFAQGGDFIGGENSGSLGKVKRKCMNSWFCSVDKPFDFLGIMNDDVNTYSWYGSTGKVFLTVPHCRVSQIQTQTNDGALTDLYLDLGTYIKSFYTILWCPSACKISILGNENPRIHHRVIWKKMVPKIISESYKKVK
jgi:hypothetical protein